MFSHHCTCGMHAVCSYESQFNTLLQLIVCVATGGIYQIIIHIPPPEPWLAMNFKRTFSLVQINHCSSLTTKRKSAYGKKNFWEISFETQERVFLCFMYGCDAWSLCKLLAAIYSSPVFFPKINMPRKTEVNSGLLGDIPETLTGPTSGTAPLLNFLVNNCYP